MKHWIWLRVAAVLQALGTILHTIATASGTASGSASPGSEERAVLDAMHGFHFDIMGSSRSVWDFYRGYEFSMTVVFAILGGADVAVERFKPRRTSTGAATNSDHPGLHALS